jgi:hypothetical protein
MIRITRHANTRIKDNYNRKIDASGKPNGCEIVYIGEDISGKYREAYQCPIKAYKININRCLFLNLIFNI